MKEVKLGIGTYCYSYAVGVPGFMPENPMSPFELIDKAVYLGVSVVQIADNYPLHKMSEDELYLLSEYAKNNKIILEIGTRGIKTEHLKKYLEIAEILQSDLLRVVIDTQDHKPDYEEILLLLNEIIPELERTGVVLGIENHDRFKSRFFAEIVRSLNTPWIGIVLDTVNSFSCEENTRQVMDELAKYTVNFHVKDFVIRRVPNSMGLIVTGEIAGKGFLNIPEMIKELREVSQQDFSIILEHWMQPEKTIEETVKKEEVWVKESISYLKKALKMNAEMTLM